MQTKLFRTSTMMIATLAILSLFAAQQSQAQITIGGTNSNNAYPFALAVNAYSGEYQEEYTSSAFSGPFTITGIAFESTLFTGSNTDTLTISLGTTTTPLSSMSTTYALNETGGLTQVFSGTQTLTALNNSTFDTVFNITPFLYNPTNGNLLMDVDVTANEGNQLAWVSGTGSPDTSRVYNFGGNGAPTFEQGGGLETQFSGSASTPGTPEPGSAAFLIASGLSGGLLYLRRRRK